MNINKSKNSYDKMIKKASPNSNLAKDTFMAFLIGGAICVISQLINFYLLSLNLDKVDASSITSALMIFLGAILTGFGVYDNIAYYAKAGTLVPITGFANSIVSGAMEYKTEGYILGVGAKMFTIAGPVIVYGICASVIYGIIHYIVII